MPDEDKAEAAEVPIGERASRFRLEQSRQRISKLLSRISEVGLFQMIWAVDQVQDGESEVGRRFIDAPPEAVDADVGSRWRAHKWFLEDLVNLKLTIDTLNQGEEIFRILRADSYAAFAQLYNCVMNIDEFEYATHPSRRKNVIGEMPRIAHRQFPWQVGSLDRPNFYRSMRLFGTPRLEAAFVAQHEVSPADMMMLGLAIWAQIGSQPTVNRHRMVVPEIGLTQAIIDQGLRLISAPASHVRQVARTSRSRRQPLVSQPSALRPSPCVSFDRDNNIFRVPLRELVTRRTTSGLYYDLVGISDDVRRELGTAFEDYSRQFFEAVFLDSPVSGSVAYRYKANPIESPDILVGDRQRLALLVECKAARMKFDARFALNRVEAGQRGREEVAKGIRQIWRFRSHVRRGLVPGFGVGPDTFGLVLTIDPWLHMAVDEHQALFQEARVWCERNEPEVELQDQCPVGITHIEDFERLALRTNETGIISTCRLGANPDFIGWGYNELSVRADAPNHRRPYPFLDDFANQLPWYAAVERARRAGE